MQNLLKSGLTGLVMSASLAMGAAQAAIVTVQDNFAGSQYLAPGQTLSGTFDLRPYLQQDTVIDWARVTFEFSDDNDPLRLLSRYGSYHSGYHYNYRNDPESVLVTTFGQSAVANTPTSIERVRTPRQVSYTAYRRVSYRESYRCGFLGLRTCYRTRYRTVPYTAYRTVYDTRSYNTATGLFTASYLLDQTAINRLLDTGLADFGVRSTYGDSLFRNATLTAAISQVPEPPMLILLGLGLAGFYFQRRRREHALSN